MATGTVDFFNDTGGYGFIDTDDAEEDVFFHMEDVGGPDLEEGQEVEFDATAETLTYHGHCHQKATKKDHHAVGVLRRAGYEVDALDSGCCGMAGSFGYEAEHYSMSKAIGRILFDQVDDSPGDTVVAPGASCRSQLSDRDGGDTEEQPPHPVERLADALAGPTSSE